MSSVTRVCFVCLGNVVRSPLAEHLFLHKAREKGVDGRFDASSAACGPWHVGEPPDARMRRVAARHGLVYDGRARQFKSADFDRFDLVIAMDKDNYNHLASLARSEQDLNKIHLLREFDPSGSAHASVPDPYYGGIHGFEEVYQVIDRSTEGLLETLEKQVEGSN